MKVESKEDSEDEVFVGKVSVRELNIIKERFLTHRIPRQLEEPFQSYSDSEIETCDKIYYSYPFKSSREYQFIDRCNDKVFRKKCKSMKSTPDDVVDLKHSHQTISNNGGHKSSNPHEFQGDVIKRNILNTNVKPPLESYKDQSVIERFLSLPSDIATETLQKSPWQHSYQEEKLSAKNTLVNGDNLNSVHDIMNETSKNSFIKKTEICHFKVSKRKISSGSNVLESSDAKEECETILTTVTSIDILMKDESISLRSYVSTEETSEIRSPASRNTSAKNSPELGNDLKIFIHQEGSMAKRCSRESVKTTHCTTIDSKTPRKNLDVRTDASSTKTPQRSFPKQKFCAPTTPCVSSERKYPPRASSKKRFSHIQSPVAAYIRNQSTPNFRTPKTPAKRKRDDQPVRTTSAGCAAPLTEPTVPFPKIPKVKYVKVPSLYATSGKIAEKIPKKARDGTPCVLKHTGRLRLIPVIKDLKHKLEPSELSILLNRNASFSDTI